MNQNEAERIRRVYAGYDADPKVQRRWDPTNRGNAANREALKQQIEAMLPGLDRKHILEIGCGSGDIVALLLELGAEDDRITAVDLRADALARAHARFPQLNLVPANAEQLPMPDCAYDVVVLFTVLSSVLAPDSRAAIARESARVLRPGGVVLWYDMRFSNPWNEHVRALSRAELAHLFPGFTAQLQSVTLLPQLARRLGPFTGFAFPLLHAIPWLRTHWLGMLRKPTTS